MIYAYYNFTYYNKESVNKWINFTNHGIYSDLRINNWVANLNKYIDREKFNLFIGEIRYSKMNLSIFSP